MELPETAVSRRVDPLIRRIGAWISWVWLALLGVIVVNVLLRYAFNVGRIEFEEIQWHLYSLGFLFGLSYALEGDHHVRVDVIHERLTLRTQAWLELYGILLLLLPFIALVLIYAVPFVTYSWRLAEISQAPGGLPLRWLIKAVLPVGFFLVLVAAISRLTRVYAYLFGAPR